MNTLGYHRAKIPTQTNIWLTCREHIDSGFLPAEANLKHNYEGWCIVKALTSRKTLRYNRLRVIRMIEKERTGKV